jgi:uroporphyrin-III C-methyltransferase
MENNSKRGIVYLIGAGPGDPELLTLKALKYIKEADVALVDDLVGEEIRKLVYKECKEVIEVGKREGKHKKTQDEINQLMFSLASRGKRVARVKGGDPFIFGRGGEEAEFLAERGIEFTVIPGISSAVAAPSFAAIPLNHRKFDPGILIMPGKEKEGEERIDWKAVSDLKATIVILMGVSNLEKNVKRLIENGKSPDTRVAIIESATTERQRVIEGKLSEIVEIAKKEELKSPAVIVIGDVVSLRDKLRGSFVRP